MARRVSGAGVARSLLDRSQAHPRPSHMLRTALVFSVVLVGVGYAFQGPIYALLLYLWIAYFRPEAWVWDPGLVMSLKLSYLAGLGTLLSTTLAPSTRWRLDLRVGLLFAFLGHTLLSTIF